MSKFLSKMWVMVTLVAVSVVLLGLYLYMVARPISYGMWYSYSHVEEVSEGQSTTIEMSFKFINDKKLLFKVSNESNVTETEMWYVKNGRQVLISFGEEAATETTTEEEFDAQLETLKEDKELWNAIWSGEEIPGGTVLNASAFKLTPHTATPVEGEDEAMSCSGAVWYAVIMGIVEVALITFAVLSVIYYIKGKKVVVTAGMGEQEKVEEVASSEEKKEE